MRKALFITHDTGNYGASRSLQLLLNRLDGMQADIVVQRPMGGALDEADLRRRFGPAVGRVWQMYLPFDTCYQYGRKGPLFTPLIRLYNGIFARPAKGTIDRIVSEGGYDLVHLNSLVLNSLISDRYPCILHMRDVYDGSDPRAVANVRKAAGVIFIDEATRLPFRDVPLRKSIVLNNPIDMTGAAAYAGRVPASGSLDPGRHTIFSVIGVVSEKKGTGFIIETFLKHDDPNARLLIVGGREQQAIRRYRSLAGRDPRVVFWGEEPEILKVYALSDYVIRGEAFPCVGRTVYEGLYAGCGVVLPGDPSAPPPMFESARYGRDLHWYAPRDGAALLGLFRHLSGTKASHRELRSNVDDYVLQFRRFADSLRAA